MTRTLPRFSAALFSLAVLAGASSAHSDVIYDSGVEPSNVINAQVADRTYGAVTGDDFTLSSASRINGIQWTGSYYSARGDGTPEEPDDFIIEFYDFSGASPATSPLFTYHIGDAVNRTDTGAVFGNGPIYSFSAIIPDTVLAPGRYLLSIYNNTSAEPGNDYAWAVGMGGDGTFVGFSGSGWGPLSGAPNWAADFTLLGSSTTAVPEPSSVALAGIGGLGLACFASRRRRA